MIGVLAYGAFDRIIRRTVFRAALARLDVAGQFLDPSDLDDDKLPSFIERFLDLLGDVDNLRDRQAFVPAADEAVKDLYKVEGIPFFPVGIEVLDFRPMLDRTLASQ